MNGQGQPACGVNSSATAYPHIRIPALAVFIDANASQLARRVRQENSVRFFPTIFRGEETGGARPQ
jgi:hypothetical protein